MLTVAAVILAVSQPMADLRELDRFVREYRALGLPVPSKDAPLVFIDAPRDGIPRRAAYLLQGSPNPKGLVGTLVKAIESPADMRAVNMATTQPADIMLWVNHGFRGESAWIPIAAIEGMRGNVDFAARLLSAYKDAYDESGEAKIDMIDELRSLAIDRCIEMAVMPGSDRREILRKLEMVRRRIPKHFNEWHKVFADRLRAAVTRRYQGSDEDEKLIDALCESTVTCARGSIFESDRAKHDLFFKICARGRRIIPKLMEHLDDPRLSRAVEPGLNNFGPQVLTVGDICVGILAQFSPHRSSIFFGDEDRRKLRQWWAASKSKTDRQLFFESLKLGDYGPETGILHWAEKNEPRLLVEAHRILLGSNGDVQIWPVLEAMVRSPLERGVVLTAAKAGLDAADYDHVHSSVWCLKELDLEEFDQALIATLNRLPSREQNKPDDLHYDRIASFAQQVAHSASPAVWGALLTATRRAEPDLRVGLISASVQAKFDKPRKLLLFKYLLALLDDDLKGTARWTNQISVQDQAARCASYILDVSGPREDATPSELAAFRSKVKTAMEDALTKGLDVP